MLKKNGLKNFSAAAVTSLLKSQLCKRFSQNEEQNLKEKLHV
jgi:hypothetical protein